ncbi:Kdm2a [Phodopus roborovskii]|uniref:Kdm2a protein n=1 Tax=Phodopus roborovskii TaxID=109678 RepID=A0AAU9YSP4_PHORO|nr:Kdm2a [Phodopus roborovskii]
MVDEKEGCTYSQNTQQVDLCRGQPGLQREFQDSQNYTEKPCLKKVI